ncbi:MAG: FAD-dependent oxidoreductase [Deltaproteobacteria bacterium]|nr:FAD-dependent oxidoreductase [Deltaproteobacteria bacterium]
MNRRHSHLSRRQFLVSGTAVLTSPALVKASVGLLSAEAAPQNKAREADESASALVIIGAGGSGLAAAVAAAEQGVKKIVVLETLDILGGNSVYAGGIFGAESKVLEQKRTGMRMTKDEAFNTMMESGRWRLNAPLVRALVDGSGETVDWLAEQGVDFGLMPSMPGDRVEAPQTESGESSGGKNSTGVKVGSLIVPVLLKRGRELGIQFLTRTRAKQLLKDNSGRITGVLAEQKDGDIKISARSCVIATGGFAGNVEMMSKYLPPFQDGDDVFVGGIPHKGDGIKMAEEAGACLEPRGATEFTIDRFHESVYLPFITNQRTLLSVNKRGERIPDNTNNVWRQPGKTAYLIFDEKMKQTFYQEEPSESDRKYFGTTPWAEKKGVLTDVWANAEKDLQSFSKKGKVKITTSWDEMAGWMGVSPDVLKKTINEYNAGCDSGTDIYGRDKRSLVPLRTPPYYAIKSCLNLLVTHGVIKTNNRMQVMGADNEPIPGLYVAGDDIGGVDEDIYTGIGGHSIGFAVTSGRLAGLNAASFLAKS